MPQLLSPLLLLQPLVARSLLMLQQQMTLHCWLGQMHTQLQSLLQLQGSSSSKSSRGGAGSVLAASALPPHSLLLAAVTERVWSIKQPHQLLPLPQPQPQPLPLRPWQ